MKPRAILLIAASLASVANAETIRGRILFTSANTAIASGTNPGIGQNSVGLDSPDGCSATWYFEGDLGGYLDVEIDTTNPAHPVVVPLRFRLTSEPETAATGFSHLRCFGEYQCDLAEFSLGYDSVVGDQLASTWVRGEGEIDLGMRVAGSIAGYFAHKDQGLIEYAHGFERTGSELTRLSWDFLTVGGVWHGRIGAYIEPTPFDHGQFIRIEYPDGVSFQSISTTRIGTEAEIRDPIPMAEWCSRADLAEPRGVLDLSDVVAFAQDFISGARTANYAPPLDVLDLQDITGFVDEFVGGCP